MCMNMSNSLGHMAGQSEKKQPATAIVRTTHQRTSSKYTANNTHIQKSYCRWWSLITFYAIQCNNDM